MHSYYKLLIIGRHEADIQTFNWECKTRYVNYNVKMNLDAQMYYLLAGKIDSRHAYYVHFKSELSRLGMFLNVCSVCGRTYLGLESFSSCLLCTRRSLKNLCIKRVLELNTNVKQQVHDKIIKFEHLLTDVRLDMKSVYKTTKERYPYKVNKLQTCEDSRVYMNPWAKYRYVHGD